MENETPNSDPRTIWTTPMDRYYIDLMLEQVVKVNRIDDHLFSRRAWKQMTSLFNAKFGLHFNKDNLKNKHKMWWKLYLAVKDLLGQKGFSWDETQKMVKADDRVWNNYIKAHPKARTFITKSIPYFTEFCKVFGNATDKDIVSGGLKSPTSSIAPEDSSEKVVSSDLGRNRDTSDQRDEQIYLINVDRNKDSPDEGMRDSPPEMVTLATTNGGSGIFGTYSNRLRTYWQPPMDYYFIELMLDQVRKRNQFDGTFRKIAWGNMIELFNAKFGFNYDILILKNRYKTLKKQYNSVKFLLQQKSFVWDDTRQMVKADDNIWHNYIKVRPDVKHYITRPVPYYKDLCFIFKDLSADEDQNDEFLGTKNDSQGIYVPHGHEDPNNFLQEEASSPSSEDKGLSDEQNSSQLPAPSTTQQYKRRRRRSSSGDTCVVLPLIASTVASNIDISEQQNNNQQQVTKRSKKNGNDDESMVDAVREMTNMVSSLSSNKRKAAPIISISPENVVYELQALPDIEEDLLLDACDYLEDEKKAKIFLSLDVRLRKKWLTRKLRKYSVIFSCVSKCKEVFAILAWKMVCHFCCCIIKGIL